MIVLALIVGHQLNTSYVEIVEDAREIAVSVDVDPHDTQYLDTWTPEQMYQLVFGDFQPCSWDRSRDQQRFDPTMRLWHGEAHFTCAGDPRRKPIYLSYVDRLARNHHALARITTDGVLGPQTVLKKGDAVIDARAGHFTRFLELGIEHIATGWDHLAFILALLLGARRLREALLTLTLFTVAHSVTLALAWLKLVALSPKIVEPLIALSIVIVCVQNIREKHTAVLAFGFGLVHGLGFASILEEAHFAPNALVVSLVAFNLGVEITQIALVSVSWPLAKRVTMGRRILNAALAAVGLVWAVQRVL